jgi:DNA polymerase-4
VLQARLLKDGFERIGQLQSCGEQELTGRYGDTGAWLYRLANGQDDRSIEADGESKSISAETTFEHDIASRSELERILWDQAERVSKRAKAAGLGGRTVTLKLKTSRFRIKTRSASLGHPTQLAHVMFRVGRQLLGAEADGTSYRLLGIGLSHLQPAADCDPPELLDPRVARRTAVELAIDDVRAKFGDDAVRKGV